VWPDVDHIDETLSTLRFATRMMRVKTTPVRETAGGAMTDAERARLVAAFEREISALKTELALHDAMVGRWGVHYGPVTAGEMDAIRGIVDRFVAGEADEVEVSTVRHLQVAMHVMRDMVRTGAGALQPGSVGDAAGTTTRPVYYPGSPVAAGAVQGGRSPARGGGGLGAAGAAASPTGGFLTTRRLSGSAGLDGLARQAATAAGSPATAINRSRLHDEAARAAELDKWKTSGAGVAPYQEYLRAKRSLREKKAECTALAAAVNDAKKDIDAVTARLAGRPSPSGGSDGDISPSTQQEGALLAELQAAKAAYRLKFEELNDGRREVEYLQRGADQLAHTIATEFNKHWLALCGGGPAEASMPGALAIGVPAGGGAVAGAGVPSPAPDDGSASARSGAGSPARAAALPSSPHGYAAAGALRSAGGGGGGPPPADAAAAAGDEPMTEEARAAYEAASQRALEAQAAAQSAFAKRTLSKALLMGTVPSRTAMARQPSAGALNR
jgi:kinesin family protein 6/9